ncbi:hypothetical protein [Alicyclobacillus macrosporangiidus]|nr:hypothetical protein [Alicyclobacillus macrosporangiidus]
MMGLFVLLGFILYIAVIIALISILSGPAGIPRRAPAQDKPRRT